MGRLNWGLIGGGEGSQIGPAHRLGARVDGLFDFVAGAAGPPARGGAGDGQRLGLAADRSYGVQVARLAGLPAAVVDRAKVVLEALESGERQGGARPKALIDDLPLFSVAPAAPLPAGGGEGIRCGGAVEGRASDEMRRWRRCGLSMN